MTYMYMYMSSSAHDHDIRVVAGYPLGRALGPMALEDTGLIAGTVCVRRLLSTTHKQLRQFLWYAHEFGIASSPRVALPKDHNLLDTWLPTFGRDSRRHITRCTTRPRLTAAKCKDLSKLDPFFEKASSMKVGKPRSFQVTAEARKHFFSLLVNIFFGQCIFAYAVALVHSTRTHHVYFLRPHGVVLNRHHAHGF